MTPKTFWTIAIRIATFVVILELISYLSRYVSYMAYYLFGMSSYRSFDWGSLLLVLATVLCYVFIIRLGFFKTDYVIDRLKLTHEFDDEILVLNTHRSTVLKICVMVGGLLILSDAIPTVLVNLIEYFQKANQLIKFIDNPATYLLAFSVAKVIIGFFMLVNSQLIVNFLERNARKRYISREEDAGDMEGEEVTQS